MKSENRTRYLGIAIRNIINNRSLIAIRGAIGHDHRIAHNDRQMFHGRASLSRTPHILFTERHDDSVVRTLASNRESSRECTWKICPASGQRRIPMRSGYLDLNGRRVVGRDEAGRGYGSNGKIRSILFETSLKHTRRICRVRSVSRTHVRRRVTVKHLAPAGAGYVT